MKISMEIVSPKSDVHAFERLRQTATALAAELPGIGFFSMRRRFNCFISLCRHLDDLMIRGDLSVADTQRVLILMTAQSVRARKAVACFETMSRHMTGHMIAALPLSAREYLRVLRSFELRQGVVYGT